MLTTIMWFRGRSGIADNLNGGWASSISVHRTAHSPATFCYPKPTQTQAFFLFTIASKHYSSIQKTKKNDNSGKDNSRT